MFAAKSTRSSELVEIVVCYFEQMQLGNRHIGWNRAVPIRYSAYIVNSLRMKPIGAIEKSPNQIDDRFVILVS